MRPRIAVIGGGAVGAYVGGHLSNLGHDITIIDWWPENVDAIRAHGLHITGMTEAEAACIHVPTLHLTEAQALDLPSVTRFVLQELEHRLSDPTRRPVSVKYSRGSQKLETL